MTDTTSPSLWSTCILPGCTTPTATDGQPCDGCRTALGPMLRHQDDGAPITADQCAKRDAETVDAYSTQAQIAAGHTPPVGRRNQRCWLCDQRRTCTTVDGRWECRNCATVT